MRRVGGRGVAGVKRAVAVAVLGKDRRRAGRTAVRVGFADDDRPILQPGKAGDDLEPAIDVLKLGRDARLDVPLHELRRALGVEREEIERCAGFPVAWLVPLRQCSRKPRRNLAAAGDLVPAISGPPTRAAGKTRFTAFAA